MERSLVAANYSRTRECILSGNNNKHRQEKATETMMPHATMEAPACPCHLRLSVVTCNSNREQEFRIFAKWKCVCFAGEESKCTFWWVLSVRCQLQLTCHWPRGEWVCVSRHTPARLLMDMQRSRVHGKLITPQRKLAQLTCLQKVCLGLPCGAANQAKCCQVTNATEARYSAGLTQSFH